MKLLRGLPLSIPIDGPAVQYESHPLRAAWQHRALARLALLGVLRQRRTPALPLALARAA